MTTDEVTTTPVGPSLKDKVSIGLLMLATVATLPLVIRHGWSTFVEPTFGVCTPSYFAILDLTVVARLIVMHVPSVSARDLEFEAEHQQRLAEDPEYADFVFEGTMQQQLGRLMTLGIVAVLLTIVGWLA